MNQTKHLLLYLLAVTVLTGACQPIIAPPPQPSNDGTLKLVGQACGTATSVRVRDDYAYIGFSFELVVLDIHDRAHPQTVSRLPIPTNAIAFSGDYVLSAGRAGLTVVDVADPHSPTLVGFLPSLETATSVMAVDQLVYFTDLRTLYSVDLTQPTKPVLLGSLALPGQVIDMEVSDAYAYVTVGYGLTIVDITDPMQPAAVGFFPTFTSPEALAVVNDILYVADSIFYVVDISQPAAPRELSRFELGGWVGQLTIIGRYAYVANGFDGLRILDISEPTQIVEVASYPTRSIATAVQVINDELFLLESNEGLRIFRTTGATELEEVGAYVTLGIVTNIMSCNQNVYLVAGWDNGLHWLEMAALSELNADVRHVFKVGITDLVVVDDIAYLLAGYAGFRLYDFSTPAAWVEIGSLPLLGANIYVAGNFAYVSDLDGNLTVIDVADRTAPTIVAHYPKFGFANAMAVDGELAVLFTPNLDVAVVQLTANGQLLVRDRITPPQPVEEIVLQEGLAYLATGRAGLTIVDVNDPDAARLMTIYDTAGTVHDVVVANHYAFLADGDRGVLVLDVFDPRPPQPVAHYQTLGRAVALTVAGDQIYVADLLGGMVALRFAPPPRGQSVAK